MNSNSSATVLESKPLPVVSDWSTLPSDHIVGEILTLLPFLAYPFLPSVGRSGIRCEYTLIWSHVIVFVYLCTSREMGRGSVGPLFPPPIWQLVAIYHSLWIGIESLRIPSNREPKVKDFNSLARLLGWNYSYGLLYFFGYNIFDIAPAGYSWLACIFRLMVLVEVVVIFYSLFSYFLEDHTARLLFVFTTRRVSWWYWLPENSYRDDFGPWWSFALAAVVAIAPLGLCLFTYYGTDKGLA